MEIVTGSTGAVHVTPIDDAVRNGNVGYINDKVVFTYLDNFEAVDRTANLIRINSGYGMNQGRYFKIDDNDFDEVIIENGSAGVKRADLIVARYTMDSQTGFEDISLVVIRGQSGTDYVDPTYTTGDINAGATIDDFPLYRVKINGLELDGHPEPLFTPLPDGGRLGQLEKKIDTDITIDLESGNSGNLNDCENEETLNIGVQGNLAIAHGGTGANTAAGAAKNIVLDSATADSNNIADFTELLTSEHTGGFNTNIFKRTFLKVWTYINSKISSVLGLTAAQYGGNSATATTLSQTLAVNKGGTGKTSITSGSVLVGNGTSTPTEKAVVTSLSNPTDNKIPTAKAVSEAMSAAGYGDMLKATYDPNADGIIAVEQGGTGASTVAGARNNLGLGNTSGALPIANGGTGQTTAAAARNALGLGNTTGALPVANGGTGKTSITSGTVLVGNGTSAMTERSIDTTSGGTADSNALITSGAVKSKVTEMQTSITNLADTLGTQVTYSLSGTTLTITTKS